MVISNVGEMLYNNYIEKRDGVVEMSVLKEVVSVVCVCDSNEVVFVNGWNELDGGDKVGYKEGKELVVKVVYDEVGEKVVVVNMGEVEEFIKKELYEDEVMEELVKYDEVKDGVSGLYKCLNEYLVMGMDYEGVYKFVVWNNEYVRGVSLYCKFDMYMDEEMENEVEVYDDLV